MRHPNVTIILLASLLLASCATSPAPRVDADLGKSVSSMIQAQTYDPRAAAHPPTLGPAIGDGARLENVLQAHRKDVANGSEPIAKPAQFDSGAH